MLPIRIKACSESDLRMLGDLAHNIQRVLPVTQADIDAAAALGKGWVVWKVIEVRDPLDNLRGGTQLVIKQNSITPGQNVRRVLIVQGPGGETVVIRGSDYIVLPDAIADSLSYVKAFGGTEQRNIPDNYIQRQFIYMMDGAYLLTDIVPTYDCKIEMDFQTTTVPSGSVYLLGGRTVTYGGIFFARGSADVCIVDAFGTEAADRYTSNVSLSNNTRYKFTFNNKVATLVSGGTTLFTNTFTGENSNSAALVINGLNANGTITGAQSGIYLYSFKVWNGQGELVADYVPAVQKGTVPVVGFYDTVSKTFKTATAGTFAAGGEAVPTPTAPIPITCNNGVLKYGKPIMLDSTRYYAYLSVNLTDWAYSSDSYSIPIPVTVGHKYKITVPTTNPLNGVQNTIFRYAFTDSINTDWTSSTATGQTSIPAYDMVRTNPQDTPSVEITATHPYMIIQMGANVFGYILANNLITITDQSIYVDGTVETIKDSLNNTATAEMLLKVGDYQDVQSIIDGVVTRKVGIKVFDGTENWTASSTYAGSCYTTISGSLNNPIGIAVLCSHFENSVTLNTYARGNCKKQNAFNLWYGDNRTTAVADLKQFLADQYAAGTPVIVLYPLATPTTESVAGQTLQVTDGDNTLEITQASLNGLELEAQYQASVSLTIQEVQDANLDPNVEVTIN